MTNTMDYPDPITVTRDCQATLIPHGSPISIPAESIVYVTQALGATVTVNFNGNLARIAGKDLDALGMEPAQDPIALTGDNGGVVEEELVWSQLRGCYDPEIPINIVDLGLIYKCEITPLATAGNRIDIDLTLTAPGCGMGDYLVQDVDDRVRQIPNVTEVNVELVFEPPWDQSMMSEAARLQVGLY